MSIRNDDGRLAQLERERDTFPSIGELPARGHKPWYAPLTAADVAYLHAYAEAVGSKADVGAIIREKIREHYAKTPDGAPIPFDLTPKAHDALDAALLAADPLHQQILPPAPRVERPSFWVALGMVIGAATWSLTAWAWGWL